MTLSHVQSLILHDADVTGDRPSEKDLKEVLGFHFCPDWDYLPICCDSPEWESCTCKRKPLNDNREV